MLIIASDIHLGDGTCAKSVSPNVFNLFTERLRELAYHASFRSNGAYQPVENIDIVLMGDILDPLHSSAWLDDMLPQSDPIRPWSASDNPRFAEKIHQITKAILSENQAACKALKDLSSRRVVFLPPAVAERPDLRSRERITPRLNIHYMVGNHDWYYHLPGKVFDAIRQDIISGLGLSNPADNFPWELSENEALQAVFSRHNVFGQHGDKYDKFNFDREKGRNFSSLGDVFTVEVINRYPLAVFQELGDELPINILEGLRQLTNVRPTLAAPLWITSCIQQNAGSDALMRKLKKIWDRVTEEFLEVNFVREADKAFQFDVVDALKLLVNITRPASFQTINDVVMWLREKMWDGGVSYTQHALREPAFTNGFARYIVYGHTHHHEVVPLDDTVQNAEQHSQFYFNSGTWHSYFDLAVRTPEAHKFVHYQAMSYLTFYAPDEYADRNFEAWSGAIG